MRQTHVGGTCREVRARAHFREVNNFYDKPGVQHEQRVLRVHPLGWADGGLPVHDVMPPHVSVFVPFVLEVTKANKHMGSCTASYRIQ